MAKKSKAVPDQDQRGLILSELDENMLVEAAAGTGKTTSMVARMVALLREGKCTVGTLAAVTFTRKAAAELRSRFQIELEKEVREAVSSRKKQMTEALEHIGQCFIGTIHSFCARLLRERPVEAGVDVSFEEMDEEEDTRLRKEAWDECAARLLADDPEGVLDELRALGLRLEDLEDTFMRFADYPDVDEWPAPEIKLPDLKPVAEEVKKYADRMLRLFPKLPADWGNDKLIPEYRRLPRVISHYSDLNDPVQLMQVLAYFDKEGRIVQKEWMKDGAFSKEQAKKEAERWNEFRGNIAQKNLQIWRECRYEPVVRFMQKVRAVYDNLRGGRLNYQDLLLRAAALLRDKPHVRVYFQKRFTRLLVDEFQDTDPVQAEVLLLLTADDEKERKWKACRPRPGSLFVVGDPKQSIYRFRRADIVTYNQVKKIIGRTVCLSTNFRATGDVIDWVNSVFVRELPEKYTEQSPAHVALLKGRIDGGRGGMAGVFRLTIPAEYSRKEDAVDYEAGRIARVIRHALDTSGDALPSDFMIVTRNRIHLSVYAGKLQELNVSHRVTGGSALNEVEELKLLHRCLAAVVHPYNPVLLVGALRSELFGMSDAELYRFKRAGGEFCYRSKVPADLFSESLPVFKKVFADLKKYSLWLAKLPPAAAIEKIIADLGLMVLASARQGGDVEAGSLSKAIELLRGVEREMWSIAQLVEYLGQIVELEERYDGISVRSEDVPAVRIMNLHKVKGLEAPVVFLADPSGEFDHDVNICIDRSGDIVRGYMVVHGKRTGWSAPLLAVPADWKALAEREKTFADAEAIRLRYVAATRAGSAVIVSQREKGNRSNPWRCFENDLADCPELADPGSQVVPAESKKAVSDKEIKKAHDDIGMRLSGVMDPTYDACGAKDYALKKFKNSGDTILFSEKEGHVPEFGEHGVEWGEVIHYLLQIAMEHPSADLYTEACTALVEHGLDADRADEAAFVVKSVMHSEIWKRAEAGPRRLVEVPFQVLGENTDLPTVLRGTIDLIFEEADGWVLVDYKTDRVAEGRLETLVDHYSPQIRLYAEAWETCSGQKVKECGFYLTHLNKYTSLDFLVT